MLSVHAGGLSAYGGVTLPWDEEPVEAVFQLAARYAQPTGPITGLRLSIEIPRLTDTEYGRLLASWQRLNRYVNPANPLLRADPAPPATRWATVEPADPLSVPNLYWDIDEWTEGPVSLTLRIAARELNLLLSDQQPYNLASPPTSMATVSLASTSVTRTATGLRIEFSSALAAGEDVPGTRLRYQASRQGGDWQETVTLSDARLAFDPTTTAHLLRNVQNLSAQEWPQTSGTATQPLADPVLWAFMPLADGWAQLPVPNLTEQLYFDAAISGPGTAGGGGVIRGAVRLGNDDPRLHAEHPEEQPWNVTVIDATDVTGVWELARSGNGYLATQATAVVREPVTVVDGLLWLAATPPSAADALPAMEDWIGGLASVSLRTVTGRELFPPLAHLAVASVTMQIRREAPDAAVATSASLTSWSWAYQVDAGLLRRAAAARLLPADTFSRQLPLVWRRHPTLPMIQVLPLTQTLTPPRHPSQSRQLAPFELAAATAPGDPPVAIPGDWRFGAGPPPAAGAAEPGAWGAGAWPKLLSPVSPASEWRTQYDLPMAALCLPGLFLAPAGAAAALGTEPALGLAAWYRYDLPYTDELQALAQLPREPAAASLGGADGAGPPPPAALTRTTFAAHWQQMSERAALASADAIVALARADGTTVIDALLEPAQWPVHAVLDLTQYPGALTLENVYPPTAALVLAGDAALRGLDGRWVDTMGAGLRRLAPDAPPDLAAYKVAGGSAAAHRLPDGTYRDQRGLHRAATAAAGTLLRTTVRLEPGDEVELTSLRRPCDLDCAGVGWQLWFRDLPVADGTFTRAATRSDLAEDVNDPEARSRRYAHLQGYQWRLAIAMVTAEPAPGALPLYGLCFYPLTLEKITIEADDVASVEVTGRIQLPLTGDGEQTELGNVVCLTFSATGTALTLTAVKPVSTVVEWPLSPGGLGEGAQLRWAAADVNRADRTLTISGASLHFLRLGADCRADLPPLAFSATPADIDVQVPMAPDGDERPLVPAYVRLVLALTSGMHAATLRLRLQLGPPAASPAARRRSFTADLDVDLLGSPSAAPAWQDGRLFGQLPLRRSTADGTATVGASVGSLQLCWQRAEDTAGFQFLPGMQVAGDGLPGFAAATFTVLPAADGIPDLRLDTAFIEAVLECRWGEYLQRDDLAASPSRAAVFGSSAGTVSVGYTGSWRDGTWAESFLLNGVVEAKNLFSVPAKAGYDQVHGRLTLPSARSGPLDHVRHTIRMLLNQHVLPGEALVSGTGQVLFHIAPGRSWQLLAVVEHQLVRTTAGARWARCRPWARGPLDSATRDTAGDARHVPRVPHRAGRRRDT